MFTENDFMTPRERVNEVLRQRTLEAQNDVCFGCDRSADRSDSCPEREMPCHDNSRDEYMGGCLRRDEGCNSHSGTKSWGLEDYPLASVFAPLQSWKELYDAETGLSRGTIFKELDLPFLGGEQKGGNCRGR